MKITKNSAGQAYYHLVESYWENGRSRQRTLMSLGQVGGDGEKQLDSLAQAISRRRAMMTVADLAKEISIEQTFILGPLLILQKLFERFDVDGTLERIAKLHPQLELDFKLTVFTIVACRFVKPGSKLKIFEHWRKLLYPKLIDAELPLHHLYRTLDLLAEHKEDIEKSLYWSKRDLLSEATDIVLYDLTTLRFESTCETGDLRRFGYSKEMRSDCTQIVFGLLLDTKGIPLGFEVYPGNTFEGKTLDGIVKKMREKFQIRRMIFVADRGLFSKKNLEILKADDGEFIVGHRLGSMKEDERLSICDLDKFTWIIPGALAVLETTTAGGDRLIVTWSVVRAERDRKTREDILRKIQKKLTGKSVNAKTFVSNTNYQKFICGLSDGQKPFLNDAAITEAAKKDGFFGIVTNVKDMASEAIVMNYKELWKIEDAFGEIKGTLKSRPIFHWTDQRITGHLVSCFLAYYCEAHITNLLRQKGTQLKSTAVQEGLVKQRMLTVPEAMKELCEVRAIPVKLRDQVFWCRTDIAGNAAAIFKAVGAKIPGKLLETENPAGTK